MRLTVFDHALIHAIGVMSCGPLIRVTDDDRMIRGLLSEQILPHVTTENQTLAPVIAAARQVAGRNDIERRFYHQAERAMCDWNRLRLGLAIDTIMERK